MANNDAFISYRRSTSWGVARAVFQDLREHNVDVFLDVESLGEGDFRKVITAQIRSRPYFLPIFTPTALERCREPDDMLRMEFETALTAKRRVVPLVTPDFDREEISRCLPEPLATRFQAFNAVKVIHEYFEAAMEKLRVQFLKPVDVPTPSIDPGLARAAERLVSFAAAQAPVGPTVLSAQKHFERALATAPTNPQLAVTEFVAGSTRLEESGQLKSFEADFDLTYLDLQARMQQANAEFALISNVLKSRHEAIKATISKIR